MWATNEKQVAITLTNTIKSRYTRRKKTEIAEFSIVAPQQSKFNKPLGTAIPSMIPEDACDLTKYQNELLTKNKLEQPSNTICIPTLEKHGKTEDPFPIQTHILKKVHELKAKQKLIPGDNAYSKSNLLQSFDGNQNFLTEIEKERVDNNLIENHEKLAKHVKDIGLKTK